MSRKQLSRVARTPRVFALSFKMAAVGRMEAGEPVAAVARDLNVARRVLYRWRDAWREKGSAGLAGKRGRKVGWRKWARETPTEFEPPPQGPAAALRQAERRIAELEKLVGRQQADLDFFLRALQALDVNANQSTSATPSTRSSRR
jgi:transposase-like protein